MVTRAQPLLKNMTVLDKRKSSAPRPAGLTPHPPGDSPLGRLSPHLCCGEGRAVSRWGSGRWGGTASPGDGASVGLCFLVCKPPTSSLS